MTIILKPGEVTLSELEAIYFNGEVSKLHHDTHLAIEKGAQRIAEIAAGSEPVYGVNTGFGKLASIKIDADKVTVLQRNLICGVGEPLAENIVRLIMSLKLISLGRGASGVRLELVNLLENMLEKGVIPVIPEKGSVGASGDLAPLAHMAAVMMGEGEAFFQNIRMSGALALEKAG
ncbi:aromatic amino acid lyase, partial [Bartonella sp. AP58NXGY]|uniref:aromatic amino acid lyase n=1 Tax=Bartonella sp. AP58NXGY TaxID=3243498 RepID=UPI0035D09817